MWVRKSSLNLRLRTVYPRMKELVVLLTDYKKVLSLLRPKKPQELETWLAEHREKHRIHQRKYYRKPAEKWSRNPQGLAEHQEKHRIHQREYRRKRTEKWSQNPQGLAEHREKKTGSTAASTDVDRPRSGLKILKG